MDLDAHSQNPLRVTSLVTDAELVPQPTIAEMEQVVLEATRTLQANAAQAIESMEAAINEHAQQLTDEDLEPKKKRKKRSEKEGTLNTCLAAGCDRQIKQRRLCPMHQKQKERNNGKLELKENVKFSKGRSPTPFSKHANKYAKLKIFDKKIDEWAGGREEGTMMLEAYMDSSYYTSRFPKMEDFKVYEQVGKNIIEFMKHLPEKTPIRRPLVKAISENVPLARLREVLPISKQTVINSKKLPDQENLLLTIRYKPSIGRRKGDSLDGLDGPLDDLQIPTAQLEPPTVDGRTMSEQSQDEILHSGSLVQGLAFQALSVPVLHSQPRLMNATFQ